MTKRTAIEHDATRLSRNGCPHCKNQPVMFRIDYEDGVTRYLTHHHSLTTSARQCPNISRFGLGIDPDAALENWLSTCRDKLAQRVSRSHSDRLFDKAQEEIELAIIPQTEQTIGQMFSAYGNLQNSLQQAMHRTVNISDTLYCIVYFDVAQDGVETKLLNKQSNIEVNLLATLEPDALIAYGKLQQRIQQWVADGMSSPFPISNDEDAHQIYLKSANQQISGQNRDSSE